MAVSDGTPPNVIFGVAAGRPICDPAKVNRAKQYNAAFITSCAIGLIVACGSGGGDGNGDGSGGTFGWGGEYNGDGDGDAAGTVTYATLESIAQLIYDDLDNTEGEPEGDEAPHIEHLNSHIAGVLEGLGYAFLDEDELSEDELTEQIEDLLDAGRPFVTTTLVYQLARAYDDGILVDVPGYFEGLEEQGVTTLLGGALSLHDWVSSQVYSTGYSAAFEPDVPIDPKGVASAFLWALGQERLRRSGGEALEAGEVIWGDNRLDPLQFTLLNYIVFSTPGVQARSSKQFLAPQIRPAFVGKIIKGGVKKFIKDQLMDEAKGQVTDFLQDVLEVPLDPLEGAQVSVCASLLLYGHRVYLENDPTDVWHKNSGSPTSTTVSLLLNFEDDYSNNTKGQVAAFLSDCDLPPKGFVPGKTVKKWSVAGAITGHGEYTEMDTVTDELGTARATWETIEDNIKSTCRSDDIMNHIVDGVTEAKVSGLLPKWGNLETIVTTLRSNTGAQGHAPLAVHFKRQRTDRNCHYPD